MSVRNLLGNNAVNSALDWYMSVQKRYHAAQIANALSSVLVTHIKMTCGNNDAVFEAAIELMREQWRRSKDKG